MGQGQGGGQRNSGIPKKYTGMKVNKYLVFALIFFFVNSVGLPIGISYMALLSPLLYWWVLTARKKEVLLPFFIALLPFVVLQVLSDVEMKSYLTSLAYYITVYIFAQAAYTFLLKAPDLNAIFRKILVINFIFCLIAIPLYFTPFYDLLWIEQYLTNGVNNFRRFKLFTYEASYYSTLFVPIFFYYFFRIILRQNRGNSWLLLVMITLPILLSFSLGVITAMTLAVLLTFGFHPLKLFSKRRTISLLSLVVGGTMLCLLVMTVFFPGNALFVRIGNIFSGQDLSGKGRTTDSFFLADRILGMRHHLWGVGAGQIKIVGNFIVREFYAYPNGYDVIGIPNAVAETWVVFGWAGLLLRMGAEIFFFFRTRVWTNYFRLALFLFIFVYQFSGSFITSQAEYLIWLLAFVNVFPQFDAFTRSRMQIPSPILKPLLDV
jgi:hypothetical protein